MAFGVSLGHEGVTGPKDGMASKHLGSLGTAGRSPDEALGPSGST